MCNHLHFHGNHWKRLYPQIPNVCKKCEVTPRKPIFPSRLQRQLVRNSSHVKCEFPVPNFVQHCHILDLSKLQCHLCCEWLLLAPSGGFSVTKASVSWKCSLWVCCAIGPWVNYKLCVGVQNQISFGYASCTKAQCPPDRGNRAHATKGKISKVYLFVRERN